MSDISRYNYTSINSVLLNNIINSVNYLFDNNIVKPEITSQTLDNLFDEESYYWNEDWRVLRDTFLNSIYQYSGNRFDQYKAWVYASFPGVPVEGPKWHSHPHSKISGILYLTLPVDIYGEVCYTTEFVEENRRITLVEPDIGSWFIFDSKRVHRPGFWDYKNIKSRRFCLAASVA
jgi:hypothetical protein